MTRFFVEKINPLEKYIILEDPCQLHHLKNVLRVKPKEKLGAFDGLGNQYIVLVSEVTAKQIKLEIKERKTAQNSGIKITVACAIPKNVKMDDIVDKLTQLGVECIVPLETERVIVKLDRQKSQARLERWEKISQSATKQSQQSKFISIEPITKFKDVLVKEGFDLKLIPTLAGQRRSLREIFNHSSQRIKRVLLLIGPEGDFTAQEVSLAKEAGFLPVSLGQTVLRVDTAAIAAVSFIKLNEEC